MNNTFIIQGKLNEFTRFTVESLNRFYPKDNIIISTYPECKEIADSLSKYGGISLVVTTEDPGPLKHPKGGHEACLNLNRHIKTCHTGLCFSKTHLSCIVRPDIEFYHGNLWDAYSDRIIKYVPIVNQIFNLKVMVPSVYTVDPRANNGFSFHPSDWLRVGTTKDLQSLYDIELMKNEDVERPDGHLRYRNEQYMFLSALKKKGWNVDLDYDSDKKFRNNDEDLKILIDHFLVADLTTLGIYCKKYPSVNGILENDFLISESKYVEYYQELRVVGHR